MKISFSKKEKILLIIIAGLCIGNMFLKPAMEASKFINGVAKDPERAHQAFVGVVTYNYFLDLHYMLLFPVLAVFIVFLVRIGIKSGAFLTSAKGLSADYLLEEEKEDLIDKFEIPNLLMDKIDAFFIAVLMIVLSTVFCGINDGFQGLKLWETDPVKAAIYSFYPSWVVDVFTVPSDSSSIYAMNWFIPTLVIIIALSVYAFRNFYKAKKVYCNLFPEVHPEKMLNPLILVRRNKKLIEILKEELINEQAFSEVIPPPKKEINMFTRQEEIDREENNFFAAGNSPEDEPPLPSNIVLEEMGESEDEELIPEELDLSRLKLKPEGKITEEKLKPCPLCGSLNPENADECCFCGSKMDI